MRARLPDETGTVMQDGVRIGYEVYGQGDPTLVLLPTWTIIHSRFWKLQIPYLARHYRVVTFDGPGNGRSDRPDEPRAYTTDAVPRAALAVMEAAGIPAAVLVSLSKGAYWSLWLSAHHPARVLGQVFIGNSLGLTPPPPERADISATFHDRVLNPQGWQKYNAAHWLTDFADFVDFFFAECFPEPHSTKQREDTAAWASETTPQVLLCESAGDDSPDSTTLLDWCTRVDTPVLVVHGSDDRVSPAARAELLAAATGGRLVLLEGCGHIPLARDPVRVNRLIADFVEALR